jgi:hypothetical protein
MPSLWDSVFIQVLDRTGPLMLNLSGTSYRSIQCEKEFLREVMEVLGSISTSELQDVFRNWMKRPEGVIEAHGEYGS